MPNPHLIYSDTPKEAEAFVAARVSHESGKLVLFVTPNDREMDLAVQQLEAFAKGAIILPFPAWDCLPYDRSSPKHSIMAQRLSTLSHILNAPLGKRLIIVTTINALTQKLPPRSSIEHATLVLAKGTDLNRDALMRYLVANGYTRVSKVMEPASLPYAEILSIFSPAVMNMAAGLTSLAMRLNPSKGSIRSANAPIKTKLTILPSTLSAKCC